MHLYVECDNFHVAGRKPETTLHKNRWEQVVYEDWTYRNVFWSMFIEKFGSGPSKNRRYRLKRRVEVIMLCTLS